MIYSLIICTVLYVVLALVLTGMVTYKSCKSAIRWRSYSAQKASTSHGSRALSL